jgi:hypothetical protein
LAQDTAAEGMKMADNSAPGFSMGLLLGLVVVLLVIVLLLGVAPIGNEGRPIIDLRFGR